MDILVGCDPEFFVTKEGKPYSAYGLVPGTKHDPYVVPDGAVQVDGMALEFNINPAKTASEFQKNISSVLKTMRDMVSQDFEFSMVPSVIFTAEHMREQPPEAKELGCEPDYDAWSECENPRPNAESLMRTASGHVHIGFMPELVEDYKGAEHMRRCITLAKQLDCFLGVPSVLWDDDKTRRSMYGKAGAFRPKPYGIEYRTLSNAWLKKPSLTRFVFDSSVAAVKTLKSGHKVFENNDGYIKSAVNYSSRNYAEYFYANFLREYLQNCDVSIPKQLRNV